MADFVKKTWTCGDSITADELNRMENGIEEAVECCGGGSAGYECVETTTLLTDESVTTVLEEWSDAPLAILSYSEPIEADTIKVTFNGTEYTCQRNEYDAYGAPWNEETQSTDWSEYPFEITSNMSSEDEAENDIYTQEAGTYQIKIETFEESVETSECFEKAVNKVVAPTAPLVLQQRTVSDEITVQNATFGEIAEAYLAGRAVLLDPDEGGGDTPVDPTPTPGFVKSYYSLIGVSGNVSSATITGINGGSLYFGGTTTSVYTANTNDDYPIKQ